MDLGEFLVPYIFLNIVSLIIIFFAMSGLTWVGYCGGDFLYSWFF